METLLEVGDYCHPRPCSPEGETVCAALSRYENTLRDAIREIHVDVSAFKIGMERRFEETSKLSTPLSKAVSQLQEENQQLKTQLEALTQQVELLMSKTIEQNLDMKHNRINNHSPKLNGIHEETHEEVKEIFYGKGQAHIQASDSTPKSSSPTSNSPPIGSRVSSMVTGLLSSSSPSTTRFSSRATFALSSKNSSDREEPIEVDPVSTNGSLENGHAHTTDHLMAVNGKLSPPTDLPLHTAPSAVRMPHMPITATTKTAEIRALGSPISPCAAQSLASDSPPLSQSPNDNHLSPVESPVSSVKTWIPAPVRTLGSPRLQEKSSAPPKCVTHSGLPQQDRDSDVISERPGGERRRELVRSQTLPRNIGAQARRSIFEKLDSEANNNRGPKVVDSKPKLKRSQSFGVSSASSIKQVLLEWCRSKTIGYQNIDIQNFSSSWSDGMAFCALVHSFFPTQFDYTALSPANRKHNFELAFGTAEAKAGCDRLIEVDDMMIMGRKPDPMCVFTYVQSLYNHLRKFE
ncbi:smoothelin, like [Periophthalmus magnuspinnatus]|uniref:smoothelin, like n=1 Tax=Periophthalmus magnuspinnatus TaxID=409849 RepID=UPI00145AE7D9|nr:smoothelin, like [Periophthalmus magnuspinnatus]XP_055081897.1 smoothelin, like [Periophthalmus magnuspinnatus]